MCQNAGYIYHTELAYFDGSIFVSWSNVPHSCRMSGICYTWMYTVDELSILQVWQCCCLIQTLRKFDCRIYAYIAWLYKFVPINQLFDAVSHRLRFSLNLYGLFGNRILLKVIHLMMIAIITFCYLLLIFYTMLNRTSIHCSLMTKASLITNILHTWIMIL